MADLLLLHAGVADRRMWAPILPALEERHRVLAPDLRGFGDAPFPDGDFSHVDDLIELLDAEDVEAAAVVGASNGGRVALDLALAHPERVSSLALAAPALGGWEWSQEVQDYGAREDELFEAGDLDATVELNLVMWVDGHGRSPGDVDPEVRALVAEMQRRALEHAAAAFAAEPFPAERRLQPPAIDRLGELRLPILVVLGGRDVADFAAIGKRLADEAAARVVVFEESAHLPSLEEPERFAGLVLEAINRPAVVVE